jgi:hypothetical protein
MIVLLGIGCWPHLVHFAQVGAGSQSDSIPFRRTFSLILNFFLAHGGNSAEYQPAQNV